MSEGIIADSDQKKNRYHYDRHTPEYRFQFEKSPRSCTKSALWHGRTPTAVTGSPVAATRC